MTTGNGLKWVTFEELIDTGGTVGEYFGDPGDWITHATIQSALDDRKAAMIMVDGFEHIHLKILQKNLAGTSTAANGCQVWIWGLMGFGEVKSTKWNNSNLFAIRLGGIRYTKGSDITVSTNTVIAGPDGEILTGTEYDHGAGGAGGQDAANSIFAALHENKEIATATPDIAHSNMRKVGSSSPPGDGGVQGIGGIGYFDALLFTLEKVGHTNVEVNVAYARY